jgi:hypothetical protein
MSRDRFYGIPNLCRPEQGWARTAFLRCFLWQHFSDNPLPKPWKLSGQHSQNGAINFAYDSGQIAMRVVHATPIGGLPHAGPNHGRRAWYTNQALAELSDPNHMPTHRLLLTWFEPDPELAFDLTVARTLSPGSIRTPPRYDVLLPLPRERTAFEDQGFDTADDLETLDDFIIDDELGDADDGR